VESLAIFVILAGVFGMLIDRIARPNRYAQMTNEEFEQDAKKGSLLGAVVIGLERSLTPTRGRLQDRGEIAYRQRCNICGW
jgi:hypothetical protein